MVSLTLPGDMAKPSQLYRFADFEADVRARQLRKHGSKIKLQGQPFEMLLMLLESPGEVITREQMQQKLWPVDTFVDFEHSLNTSIKKLRHALNDSAAEPRYIETLPRVGYRFIAPVTVAEEAAGDFACASPPGPFPSRRHPRNHGRSVVPPTLVHLVPGPCPRGTAIAGTAVAFNAGKTRDRLMGILHPSKNGAGMANSAKKSRRSVAVLPLQNLSADPNQNYFADGMTDELTTDLAQFADLRVISRTSAMHYRDSSKTAPQIGKELGVDAIVEGSVERVGDRVRIRAQLIDCATDRHLWAQSYDRDLKDVLSMQTEAAREIADQVRGSVGSPQLSLHPANPAPVNPDAYEAYLKGRYFWNKRTPDGLNKSIEYFDQAIAKDPSFAAAYAGSGGFLFDPGIGRVAGGCGEFEGSRRRFQGHRTGPHNRRGTRGAGVSRILLRLELETIGRRISPRDRAKSELRDGPSVVQLLPDGHVALSGSRGASRSSAADRSSFISDQHLRGYAISPCGPGRRRNPTGPAHAGDGSQLCSRAFVTRRGVRKPRFVAAGNR